MMKLQPVRCRTGMSESNVSVGVDEESGESAVFVGVAAVNFAAVQLYAHFVAHVQVQDDTVGGVVVILVCILGDGTGLHLGKWGEKKGA